jgi:hypothetical protein
LSRRISYSCEKSPKDLRFGGVLCIACRSHPVAAAEPDERERSLRVLLRRNPQAGATENFEASRVPAPRGHRNGAPRREMDALQDRVSRRSGSSDHSWRNAPCAPRGERNAGGSVETRSSLLRAAKGRGSRWRSYTYCNRKGKVHLLLRREASRITVLECFADWQFLQRFRFHSLQNRHSRAAFSSRTGHAEDRFGLST